MLLRFVIAPLDVVKIRLQLQTHSPSDPLSHPRHPQGGPVYKGTLGTLKQILQSEGVTGLWKGNIPAEGLYITYGAIQFGSYRNISHLLSLIPREYRIRNNEHAMTFISGAGAGTIATTLTYPLDLLRTRFAAQGNDRIYASILTSLHEIKQSEGYPGFFRGVGAAVGQIIPYMGLFFTSYEALKLPLANWNLPFGSSDAMAGLLASLFSKTAVYPLDTVRKRLQVQGPTRARYVHRNIPLYQGGVLKTVAAIVQKEGIRGCYRGLTVSLVKAAPASAVTMWTFERTMGVLGKVEEMVDG
jgi:solute carrier family 25 (mitochondrial thiamine pyrophosphate transporter), member 19